MDLYPAIDLRGGRCVRLYQGDYAQETVYADDPVAQARWLQRLAPYYDEYGVHDTAGAAAPSRAPFNAEHAAMVAEFKPAVVSFHFGLPEPELLARVKVSGAKVLASATTIAEARGLADHGADAIIA